MEQLDIVLVAFYDRKTALNWIKGTKTSFPMFLDQNLKLYDALSYYKRPVGILDRKRLGKDLKIAITHFFSTIPAIKGGQSHQMGGDMIVNKECKLLYILRSETPDQRPSPKELAKLLKTLD